jgi:CubicO group peptidase (beta-lactamase class C family)
MSDAGFSATRLERTRTAMQLQQFVETDDVAGCVTLVWRNGEMAGVDTLGHSDTLTPMTRDTLFRIASMTKPVTSVAALMLVEEGRIALDDPVSRWFRTG